VSWQRHTDDVVVLDREIAALQAIKQWHLDTLAGEKRPRPPIGPMAKAANDRINDIMWEHSPNNPANKSSGGTS
jgi:hypothetical protein